MYLTVNFCNERGKSRAHLKPPSNLSGEMIQKSTLFADVSQFCALGYYRRTNHAWTCSLKSDNDVQGIQLTNVSYWRPNRRQILDDISLTVQPGELAMLVGRNGCGKSTLMRVIRGLLKPNLGTVRLGDPASFVDQNPSRQIVMPSIGSDIALFLRLPLSTPQEVAKEKVLDCLRSVGLEPAERFLTMGSFRLSGGQRQRVAVASALAGRPKVLLMDEVTGSMDAENRAELVSRMRQLVSESKVATLWYVILLL